jgi:cell wall-associated NlpC family hydrolase
LRYHLFARILSVLAVTSSLSLSSAPAHASNITRQAVLSAAGAQVGVPYVWGGENRHGFDCSGLVQYVFSKAHVQLPRTADRQYLVGTPVSYEQAKPGDLMFFNTGSQPGNVTHVGIYLGHDRMLHAPRAGSSVSVASVASRSWFRPRLLGIRRVSKEVFKLHRAPVGWERQSMPVGVKITIDNNHGRPTLVSRLKDEAGG